MRLMFAAATVAALLATTATAQSVSRRIAVPDGGWDYLSFDAASHRLFVGRSDGVMTIDVTTDKVTSVLTPATRTHAALALGTTGLGAVTSGTAAGVILFDGTTGAIKATVPTGPKPDAAIWDPASKTVMVMDNKVGTVTMVDPVTAKVAATITVGGALESAALDGRGHLYVAVEDKNEIAAIDLKTKAVTRRIALAGCEEPAGLALTKGDVLIATCATHIAKAVDAKTGKAIADLAIGTGPDSVIYDAARDRAYVATRDGVMAVIDTSAKTPKVIASVPTETGARTGAVDPATGTVYVMAAKYEPAVAGARPKAVAGSVEVLAVR
jgi:DNA-binding beta-propeller fold protein YncE